MKLCPYHKESLGWTDCDEDFDDCEVEAARAQAGIDQEYLEELTDELIEVIWAALDKGASASDIRSCISNVFDSWTPKGKDNAETDDQT